MGLFSPAQLVGYFALALGIAAFLQKSDQRLKFFNATQGLVYALHFVLLGNLPASASPLLSSFRSFLALRYRSLVLGAVIIAINLPGAVSRKTGWLPSSRPASPQPPFTMRHPSAVCCCGTLLAGNNLITGSIGGTARTRQRDAQHLDDDPVLAAPTPEAVYPASAGGLPPRFQRLVHDHVRLVRNEIRRTPDAMHRTTW